jgi:hypothetical protein
MAIYAQTNIKGAFRGYKGGAVFELANGQVWKQSEQKCLHQYLYAPAVTIYQEDSGYEMEVEGMDERVPVKKVK